ncbi:MAG TPA: hypothetical protein VE869_01870 [Gemmatimonas sp.]|nr:hypothetical protein [Gemmatimonas sp.]
MPDPIRITGEEPSVTLARVVELGFGSDEARFAQFVQALREITPTDVYVLLRGSAVAGTRWADGAPFDADGPGTSDLDLTFVGASMLQQFEEFYIPGLHSAPLCDDRPEASPALGPLRLTLCSIAGRPVNIQATSDLVQYVRDVTMQQPYVVLIERQAAPKDAPATCSVS